MTPPLLPHFFFRLPDGARLRYAELSTTDNPRGTALIIPGRREFIEKKHVEVGQPLLALGFRVITVEPRGQGLSDRLLTGPLRQRDHAVDFSKHLEDLRAFFAAVVKPKIANHLIVHGHSLGAHLTLRWLAEDHPPVAAAFVTAPMLALAGVPTQLAAYGVSWASTRLFGHENHYATSQHDFGPKDCIFPKNPLTRDESRFRIIEDYFTAHPDLMVGGVTWGWMLAALRSMHTTRARSYLSAITAPVLALVGEQDHVTPPADIIPVLNHIPRLALNTIAHARHDLLNECEHARSETWQRIHSFLSNTLPI